MKLIKSVLGLYIFRALLLSLLSLSLFIGGLLILFAQIPFWSFLFGLILMPLGISLTVFTIDDAAKKLFIPPKFKPAKCNVCGKMTYSLEESNNVICGHCRENLIDEVIKETEQPKT